MIPPAILTAETNTIQPLTRQRLPGERSPANDPVLTTSEREAPPLTVTHNALLTVNEENQLIFNGQPVLHLRVSPHEQTQVHCVAGNQDLILSAHEVLLAAVGTTPIESGEANRWCVAFIRARAALSELIALYAVTSTSIVMRGLTGSADFVDALDQARAARDDVPVQVEQDAATLFVASLCIGRSIVALSNAFEKAALASFTLRIEGGSLFLEAFRQTQDALGSLPLFHDVSRSETMRQTERAVQQHPAIRPAQAILDKKEEAGPLREEFVEQGKNQLQLYIALVVGAASFLGLTLQPNVSPFTPCLLPLAAFSIALKIAAHDLRPGQINFYLRRILRSPWEIVRRALFDGSQPSAEEQAVLAEQGIVLTPELVKEAARLTPILPELHSKANRVAILLFDGAAIGVLLVRGIDGVVRRDLLTLTEVSIALCVSVGAAIPSFIVLKRKRIR